MKIEEISLLLDFYGELLSEKQREFLRLYHEENYSLAEIGVEFGVSRQGVYDGVKKAQAALHGYEEKLHLVADYKASEAALADVRAALDRICAEHSRDERLLSQIEDIKKILIKLDQ